MSERPFMQLYVSDFIGDTLELTTEGIGAYMLLLMAMWNAGGELPDDDAKLARITRLTVRRWRAVAADILGYFERDNGRITHQRLSKELRKSVSKSELRANAGAAGGRAKALKDNKAVLANATDLPWHLPDTRDQKEIEPIAQQPTKPREPQLFERLCDAAGFDSARLPHPKLLQMGPITDLIAKGYSLADDILPVIRERAVNRTFTSWAYFVGAIVEAAQRKSAIPAKPEAAAVDWPKRMAVWSESRTWASAWGPKPGEPGCKAPPELMKAA